MTSGRHERADVRFRAACADDADAVVDIYRQAYGEDQSIVAREQFLGWLESEMVPRDAMRVLEADGKIAGYGDITILNGHVALEVAAPGFWDPFLEWAEHAARSHELSGVFFADHGAPGLGSVARGRGFQRWVSAYRMQLGATVAVPAVNDCLPGVSLRTYRPEDAPQLRAALNEVFERDPFFREVSADIFRDFYVHAPGADPSAWRLAFSGDHLAGFAISTPSQAPPGSAEINMLGVLPAWRRQGLGSALLSQAIGHLRNQGHGTVGLDVDATNDTGALRLYMKAGMRVIRETPRWRLSLEGPDQ